MRIGIEPNNQVIHPARNIVLQGLSNSLEKTDAIADAIQALLAGRTDQVDIYPILGGDADYTDMIKDAWDRAVAFAALNGGYAKMVFHGGRFHVTWDGVSGFNAGVGLATHLLNYRSCLVFDDPLVDHVCLDFTGAVLVQNGIDKDTWASVITVANATVEILGGTFTMKNKPYTQGTVVSIGADHVRFQVDSAFDPTMTPSFAHVSEVITYTAVQYEQGAPIRSPLQFAFDRDEYSHLHAPIVNEGGGIYRITGMSAGEITTFTARSPVGTYIAAIGMADGCCTFNLMNNASIRMFNCVNHMALMRFVFSNGCRSFNMENCQSVPAPDSKDLRSGQRGLVDVFNALGPIRAFNVNLNGSGDDAFGLTGFTLAEMTYLSATTFRAFSNSHYFGQTAPVGARFILYSSTYANIATGRITAVSAITPGVNWNATYTASITSGALPADMSDHIMQIYEGTPACDIQQCNFTNIRSRAIWGNLPGIYDYNNIQYVTNEAILINPLGGGGNISVFFSGGIGVSASKNKITRACMDGFYSAAIRIMHTGFVDPLVDQYLCSPAQLYKDVQVNENIIRACTQMAIMVGGIENLQIVDNQIYGANFGSEYGEEVSLGFGAKTTIGYANVASARIAGNTGRSLSGAEFIRGITHGAGTNTKIILDDNVNLDEAAPTTYSNIPKGIGGKPPAGIQSYVYASGVSAEHLIESSGSFQSKMRLKNADREFSLFGSQFGLFFKDETANLNRWVIDQNGTLAAAGNTLYDLGNAVNWIRRVMSRQFLWQDGIAAPAASASLVASYVDQSDGDLKVIFSDGVVKTLATDSGSDFRMVAVPASAAAPGNPGDFAYAAGFMYICVASNTWQRVAVAAW